MALEPARAAPRCNGEDTRRRAGVRASRGLRDQNGGLGIGGEHEELRVRALRVQALERRLNELRNRSRIVRQDVQYVLIAGDSRSLTLFQVLLHQTPDFQWPATRRRGKIYMADHTHSSLQSYAVTETATLRAFAPSANVSFLKESATIAVSARARALKAQGRKVIDLGTGEPDFDTPEFIRRAGQRAIDAGATKYTATEGIMPLREAIAADASARWSGDKITASDIVVSNGSKQSLFNACFTLFGEGDEVLIPTPSWTSYYEMVALSRAKAVAVIGDPQNGLKVTAAFLDAAATPRTAGVMLNSPCNPTGAVYSESELRDILELATSAIGGY
jgi:Aspartate/tyrosine/aromatic aminotransferase